jgi:antitoxin (DNA-binding transcriptional repressor) of toxin-antitoxin stability system
MTALTRCSDSIRRVDDGAHLVRAVARILPLERSTPVRHAYELCSEALFVIPDDDARDLIAEADAELYLTVKEFAALVRLSEKAVRQAIKADRLNKRRYRVERVTESERPVIRIVVLKSAA